MTNSLFFCLACESLGFPKSKTKGSFIGELALWILFLIIAATFGWWLLLAPLIYSIARAMSTTSACATCGSTHIIPADSPKAREVIDRKKSNR